MRVTVRFEGDKLLAKALRNMSAETERRVSDALNETGIELRGDIVKRYHQGPATGIVYEKYKPRRTHQASKDGEAPKTDTSRLANSVTYKKEIGLAVSVSTDVEYGPWLEFSTMDIEARPNWIPATEEMQPKHIRRMEAALRKAMP